MRKPLQITREVAQVGGGEFTAPEDAAIYVVVFGGRAALIDSGTGRGTRRLLENLEAVGVGAGDVDLLLLTHCHFDHTGGASATRRHFGCKVALHQDEAAYLEQGELSVTAATWYGARLEPCPVDIRLAPELREIPLGDRAVRILPIPGHSPGSVAYVVESEGQVVLFGQDVHGPLHPSLLSDEDDYQASLRRLLEVEADILCEGHYGVYRGRAEVTCFIRSFLPRG